MSLLLLTTLLVASAAAQDFEGAAAGEPPPGWIINAPHPQKPVKVHSPGAFGSARSLMVQGVAGAVRGGISASTQVNASSAPFTLEFSVAFGGAEGRVFRMWSRSRQDSVPTAINLIIENRKLLQFQSKTHTWRPIPVTLEPSSSPAEPRWQRIRITTGIRSMRIWISPSGSQSFPDQPAATMPLYRAGLPFEWLHLGCDRLAPGAFFLVDDIRVIPADHPPAEPEAAEPFHLWSGPPLPEFQDEIPDLPSVTHTVLHDPSDGKYTFLHGAAIVHHHGRFYANWANSPVDENSAGETLQGRDSPDALTWSPKTVIGPGGPQGQNNSHGVYLSHRGTLWTFSARFGLLNTGVKFPGLNVEAFTLNEKTKRWDSRGIVAHGMWPYNQPERLKDGNWITGGQSDDGDPGMLISDGASFTKWTTIKIPAPDMPRGFGETTLFADRPDQLLAIIRPGGGRVAWASTSADLGRTWTPARPTDYPIGVSKMYAGVLSTGQRYLVANYPSTGLPDRHTLTIAVGRPKEPTLRKIYRIRFGPPALNYSGFAKSPQWSYPYAYEHEGRLYIVYSIGKEQCGLSIIPIPALSAE